MAKGRVSARNLKRDPLMEQYVSTSTWVKERSRPVMTGLIVAAVVIAAVIIGWLFMSRRANNAAELLAEAFRYHEAIVANPIPANAPGYAFTTQEEKDRKAYEAFAKAARDYPSYNGDVALYYAALHQLKFEPEKAENTLKELAAKDSPTSTQAQLALAERYEATNKYELAIAELQKLKARPGSVPPPMIDFNMARIFEAQGKAKEAVDLYFNIANNKDWRSTAIGTSATTRLTILAPDKVEKLPPAEQTSPFGSFGGF